MLSGQRIGRIAVVRYGEMGWLPTRFIVAGLAIAAIGSAFELTSVYILMAVEAAREGDVRFEVLGLMAVPASHCSMLA
jgi:hypothetical protein